MRTMVSLSLGSMLVLGGAAACSSKPIDDDNRGGTGAIIMAGSGGTGMTSGGSTGRSGAASGAAAGTTSMADLCAGQTVRCLDAMTAQGCDPDTGLDVEGNCTEELAKDGFVSAGCSTDADGTGCTIDDFTDVPCAEGMGPFAACFDVPEADILNVYVACFHDVEGLHAVVPCFADFVDDTSTPPTVDCAAAQAACSPAAMP